jgi:hypothetical protein
VRLKASVWASAYIRRLNAMPIPTVVTRRGDADAGAIYIKINTLDGHAQILRPAVAATANSENERFWTLAFTTPPTESEADAYLARQLKFDPDIWVIEVEDARARHFLDDYLCEE